MSEQKYFVDHDTNNETHSFQGRLKIAMEKIGGFSALMRETGLSNSAISNYLKGRKPKIDIAIKIAEVCKVDAAWLILGGQHDKSTDIISHSSKNEIINIPLLNVEASAGNGLVSPEWQGAEMIP
ncbi:helix-turn-helix domain-containing protein, partial [Bombella apis]